MYKDKRYAMLKDAIESGKVTEFTHIFDYVPKTTIRKDVKRTGERITKLIERPAEITLDEAYRISKLIGVKVDDIINLAYKKYFEDLQEGVAREPIKVQPPTFYR